MLATKLPGWLTFGKKYLYFAVHIELDKKNGGI
jgi:hypothetical protein